MNINVILAKKHLAHNSNALDRKVDHFKRQRTCASGVLSKHGNAKEINEKLPVILNGQFFSISSKDEKGHVKAICATCKKLCSGSLGSTAKFLTHVTERAWIDLMWVLF